MLELRLTKAADADLTPIAEYTIERYGLKQARAYADGLFKALALLTENPQLGSDQGQVRANTRRLVHESHRIYYEVGEAQVLVLRILGPGQDPLRQLQ